ARDHASGRGGPRDAAAWKARAGRGGRTDTRRHPDRGRRGNESCSDTDALSLAIDRLDTEAPMTGLRGVPNAARILVLATMLTGMVSVVAGGQNGIRPPPRADTTMRASDQYDAGGLHRTMLGANYRDLWSAPITVHFLDLRTFARGILPTKTGGGGQTKTRHF